MLPEYNISLAHNALLIISMWSEAREAVCQGLPVSGRAGGPGPSPLAAVLRHLRYPHHLSRVPTSLCSHSRLVSKRSHKWRPETGRPAVLLGCTTPGALFTRSSTESWGQRWRKTRAGQKGLKRLLVPVKQMDERKQTHTSFFFSSFP